MAAGENKKSANETTSTTNTKRHRRRTRPNTDPTAKPFIQEQRTTWRPLVRSAEPEGMSCTMSTREAVRSSGSNSLNCKKIKRRILIYRFEDKPTHWSAESVHLVFDSSSFLTVVSNPRRFRPQREPESHLCARA